MRDFLKVLNESFRIKAGLLIAATAVLYALLINNLNLWTDEIYSVLMAKDSFKEMFYLLMTEDSKPPLYYLYLKGVLVLFPQQYEIFAAHFASYILLLGAQLFAATAVKKDYGSKTALWLILLIAVMPQSLWLAFEARTYMLSALLMLMALVYGLRLTRTPAAVDFWKFGTVTVLALYSHYYCAVWLMFLYALLLADLLRTKKTAAAKRLLLTAFAAAALFAPWLLVPLATGARISEDWYVTSDFVMMSPMFFYDPLAPDIQQSVFFMATFIETSAFTFIAVCGLFDRQRDSFTLRQLFWTAALSFFLTYALLLGLSYLVRPMVTARYLKIFSLIWYLAGAVVLAQNKILQKGFLLLAAIGFAGSYADVRIASFDRTYYNAAHDIRQFIGTDQTIMTLDNSNLFCEYYLPEYKCVLAVGEKGEILRWPSVMKNIDLYHQEPAEMTLILSIYSRTNSSNCLLYDSLYRQGNGISMCMETAQRVWTLLQNSLKLRLDKH